MTARDDVPVGAERVPPARAAASIWDGPLTLDQFVRHCLCIQRVRGHPALMRLTYVPHDARVKLRVEVRVAGHSVADTPEAIAAALSLHYARTLAADSAPRLKDAE